MDMKSISRIDRAVTDNLKDIERSFDSHAGIVQDFIVFITKQIKYDLFGFNRFTLQDFCEITGRNRQDLAIRHPIFTDDKIKPPEIQGYKMESVFDYALYLMVERNVVFSKTYEDKYQDQVIEMKAFSIIIDLKLNFKRKANQPKVYEVKVSNDILEGFLRRYYTINTEVYKQAGIGRGGANRQSLLLYLFKINHILITTKGSGNTALLPLDRLCPYANINDLQIGHRKQSLARILTSLQLNQFKFQFQFQKGNTQHKFMVKLDFSPIKGQQEFSSAHNFYNKLLVNLKGLYQTKCGEDQVDNVVLFQIWLADHNQHLQEKAYILSGAYGSCMDLKITTGFATDLIISGDILNILA